MRPTTRRDAGRLMVPDPRPWTQVLSLALALALLVPITPSTALVRTPITVDGSFADWSPVFDSAANCRYDPAGDTGGSNNDLTVTAATYDDSRVYLYVRRAASGGGAAPVYRIYIDSDGDGFLGAADHVLVFELKGGNALKSVGLYQYAPSDGVNGDPIASPPPGGLGSTVAVNTGALQGVGETDGSQFEGSVTWAALGIAPDTPVNLRFAAVQGNDWDHAEPISFVRAGVHLSPGTTLGMAAGMDAVYPHTVTNTGNVPLSLALTAESSRGWSAMVRLAGDTTPLTTLELQPGDSIDVEAVLAIPGETPNGTRDTLTISAENQGAAPASASARDEAVVGPLLVIPDRKVSGAPGTTVTFANTVQSNVDTTITVELSAVSDHDWPISLRSGGAEVTSPLTLEPRASMDIEVVLEVPAGAQLGMTDVTRIEAMVTGQPDVRANAYDTVTVRPALEVAPPRSLPAGPGTSVLYRHTITNSTAEERTLALTASSSLGWPAQVFAGDAATPLSEVTLAPYGGSTDVVVRVTVPAGTPPLTAGTATTDLATLTAQDALGSASVADTTIVSRLATFGVGGFGTAQDTFTLGDLVYARGMGLPAGQTVTFTWTDPSGAVMAAEDVRSDGTGIAQSRHDLSPTDLPGTWTVTLLNRTTELATHDFYVGYRARIGSLSATGGEVTQSPVNVTCVLDNTGAVDLPGTTVTYLLWWDADGDGAVSPGDSYVSGDGTWLAVGEGDGYTHQTAGLSVPGGATGATDTWSVSNEDLRFAGTYRLRAVWKAADDTIVDTRETTHFATPGKPELSMSVSTPLVDFGSIEPGVQYTRSDVTVNVSASVPFHLSGAAAGDTDQLGLTRSLDSVLGEAMESGSFTDTIGILVSWMVDPGYYEATVTYTIVPR